MSNDEWTTPQKLYDFLNTMYNFTVDAAATVENAKHSNYYTKEDDALSKTNALSFSNAFCNPPYSRDKQFAEHIASYAPNFCLLLPVRSDRIWFQNMLHSPDIEACWITGRLHFGGANKGAFMYSIILYRQNLLLPKHIDASHFNDNGKGGATK